MNKYLFSLITISLSLGANAQSKIDIGSRARLHRQQAPVEIRRDITGKPIEIREVRRSRAQLDDQPVNAFITIVKGVDTTALETLCTSYKPSRVGNMIFVTFPLSALREIESLPCVASIKTEQPISQKMNLVRPLVGVDKIHAGEDLPQPYTGKGVICGIVDGGFDPNHVNFLDADGKQRVKQFTYFAKSSNPQATSLVETRTYGDDILRIDTENDESFHATHTSGIMFGGYRGKIQAGVKESAFKASVQEIDNPYYGVATGSDIIMASAYDGQLSDQYIALGIESMLDYAYENNQPLSVNLSLGSNVGSHDGTSPICQYLDALCNYQDVNTIVSISAGNEGDQDIVLKFTYTQENEAKNEMIGAGIRALYTIKGYQHPRSGLIYIYSDSDEPFEVQAQILNTSRTPTRVATRFPLPECTEETSRYWVSDENWLQEGSTTDEIDPSFAKYFKGYVGLNAMIDNANNRYYAVIDYTMWDNTDIGGSNANGIYGLGFAIKGKAGQKFEIYGDGSMCDFEKYPNVLGVTHIEPTHDGTINDISTGKLPIIVGSYDVRDDWASLDKVIYGYQGTFKPGHMSAFTSFGTLFDGRVKPDICAPGATVISSANEYYFDAYIKDGYLTENSLLGQIQGRYDDGTRRHSWYQCLGTSMAAPVVAGSMALWLEAYPQLTTAEARKIIEETAIKDEYVTTTGDPLQWGWGKFDAYAGLKKVLELKNAGIDNVIADPDARYSIRHIGNNCYELFGGEATQMTVNVYNMQGSPVLAIAYQGNEAVVDCSQLAPGMYMMAVNNSYSQKISVK